MAADSGERAKRGPASLYQQRIQEVVPDCDPRHVEAVMRLDFGTLDQLGGERFAHEARHAAAAVRADPKLAERTAQSMGL
jgi:hypothetical protein